MWGGTTFIDESELLKTLEFAKKLFSIDEISCESDPEILNPASLMRFKNIITRLSVGVQSFDDGILRKISRYDKFGSGAVLQEKLSKISGIFPLLNIDLIFNFPFQTKEILLNDIKTAKSVNSEQITLYPLMKSFLTKKQIARHFGISSKDNEFEFYRLICKEFANFNQINAWSFAKTKCTLSDEYAGYNHEYLGLGSGAFSFLDGRLLINVFNLNDYQTRISNNQSSVVAKCDFSSSMRIKYIFLTELFKGEIDIDKFERQIGENIAKSLKLELNLLNLSHAITVKNGKITTTEFGKYLCLVLMKEFYIGMDRVRATFRDDAKMLRARNLQKAVKI